MPTIYNTGWQQAEATRWPENHACPVVANPAALSLVIDDAFTLERP